MFVPVYDDNLLRGIRFQFVTVALVAINLAVFLFQLTGLPMQAVAGFGIVPAKLLATPLSAGAVSLPANFNELPQWVT
ncbi:MAG: hypothetical protein ABL904_04580, partial [Hyphomicrobiaceae bacterium]